MNSIPGKLGWLIGATMIVALLVLAPAWSLYGATGIESVAWAAVLCLAPGLAVAVLSQWASTERRELMGLLLGMGVRMATALVGALAVCEYRPDLRHSGFLWWLSAFYLVMLAVETRLVMPGAGGHLPQGTALAVRNR